MNDFLTPENVAKRLLANLYAARGVSATLHNDHSDEFQPGKGRTVNVRKPAVFSSQVYNRNTGITRQDISETFVPVSLDTIRDVSVLVTSEEWTMDIEDFDAQVLSGMGEALAQDMDKDVIAALKANAVGTVEGNEDPRVLAAASGVLGRRNVPQANRNALISPEAHALWLADPLFHEADKIGNTDGVREGMLGRRVFGFDVFETSNVEADVTGDYGIAYHKDTLAVVSRPLAVPRGAVNAATVSYGGLSIRVTYGYDQDAKADTISADILYGIHALDGNRATLLRPTA